MTFKASVIIPTKNPGSRFADVLQAVIAQDTPWPYEILVIDSGSTDGTLALIKRHPQVRLLQIPPAEFGHGKTRNVAISQTSGEFAVLITHDALPATPGWLSQLVAATEQADDIAGAFGRHFAYPQHGPLMQRDLDGHFDGFAQAEPVVRLSDPERYAQDPGYRQFLHFFSDNNACLRRSVWQKIPYPDVDFAEDQIWAEQIIRAGYAKAYADKACVFHSHNYNIIETLRRSFDESRALRQLFGYQLCPNWPHLLAQSARCTARDWRYLWQREKRNKSGNRYLGTPFKHFARQLGYWLGGQESFSSSRAGVHLSLDAKLKNNVAKPSIAVATEEKKS